MAVVRVVPREMMAMSRRIVTVVALVVAASAGAVAYYRSRQADKTPTPSVSQVTKGDVIAKVDATGTLAPVTTVEVGSQVSGRIAELHGVYYARATGFGVPFEAKVARECGEFCAMIIHETPHRNPPNNGASHIR